MEHDLPGGYNGRILRANLTDGKVTTERIDASFCRKYIGGAGFITYFLLSEVKPGIDPLGPENKLISCYPGFCGFVLALAKYI